MKRRELMLVLGGAAISWPSGAEAQSPKVLRIGLLLPYIQGEAQAQARVNAFQTALRERGWEDHRNAALQFRYSEGRLDRLPNLAADLIAADVDLILTAGTEATGAVQKVTTAVPIVMVAIGDPVAACFIASLARPGGNITGTSLLATELSAKRLELLKESLPALNRLAVLWGPNNASTLQKLKQIEAAAALLGVHVEALELRAPADLERAFETAAGFVAEAVMTTEDGIQIAYRARVVELATRQRIPVASEFGEFAQAGALMSYGPNILDSFRNAAGYVDKILKGAKPADLPVEQPTRFELVINLKSAKALGLIMPQSLLARADEVIE
jgi:putative ABC transport system substrate-binding protein